MDNLGESIFITPMHHQRVGAGPPFPLLLKIFPYTSCKKAPNNNTRRAAGDNLFVRSSYAFFKPRMPLVK
jgi:hypothetical protein